MIVRCRICFDEENINESQQEEELRKNNFVSPCNCAGSNKYVHAKCLDQWRKQNVNNFMKCPTCAGIYNIFFQKNISNMILIPLLTSAFLVFLYTFLWSNIRILWMGNIYQSIQYVLYEREITIDFWELRNIGYACNGYFEWGNNLKNKWFLFYFTINLFLPVRWQMSRRTINYFLILHNWQFFFRTAVSAGKREFNQNIYPKISSFYLYDK